MSIQNVPLGELFAADITRDIPPVVYFHEQSPERLQAEVEEYIITGGWPEGHPRCQRVPDGIHEQAVRLLSGVTDGLAKPGGPELPTAWISGFYGSGKSSFAKLIGLALDGVTLPGGESLADALLDRDTSPHSEVLRQSWAALLAKVEPIAVVFDVGSVARDNEHIHGVALRQVQRRLGYCPHGRVAHFELNLERDGQWSRFEEVAHEVLGRPWQTAKNRSLAEEDFSLVMQSLFPQRYPEPMSWMVSRRGTAGGAKSPEEAVSDIADMLQFRRPGATLFLVIDEVSQYVMASKDRVDRLRAFTTALGAGLRGRAWLFALGQQKVDEDGSILEWLKDRFPPRLRVHLAATNIQDVVHKRLLQKTSGGQAVLRELFEKHRADLKLFGGCDGVAADEFAEVYPLLPGQIDVLLQMTSALRLRTSKERGDEQAIRGLLQVLGDLFRSQGLADKPLGSLVTLDQIYDVLHGSLEVDTQTGVQRVQEKCADDVSGLMVRIAKTVALLELIQDKRSTEASLVTQSLFDRVDRGNQGSVVTAALEELRRRNLLNYSEKTGYKLQSSAAGEWERERREIGVADEMLNGLYREHLKALLSGLPKPRLKGLAFHWGGVFAGEVDGENGTVLDPRSDGAIWVDFRFLAPGERGAEIWVKKSAGPALTNRLVWVAGETDRVDNLGRDLQRSRRMVERYQTRRDSLKPARRLLLVQEEDHSTDLSRAVGAAISEALMDGRLYFRGRSIQPISEGASFDEVAQGVSGPILRELYPHCVPTKVSTAELMQLIERDIPNGVTPKFLTEELGVLEEDGGRYVAACRGVLPTRVLEALEAKPGCTGASLLAHFGAPPYGYTANVVKACVLGLLRASRLTIQPEVGAELTAVREAGVREVFEKDHAFRRAAVFPAAEDDVGFQARARICKFFNQTLGARLEREDHAIADAAALHFPKLRRDLRDVLSRLDELPGATRTPVALRKLEAILEQCIASSRDTNATVRGLKRHLSSLRDGVTMLQRYEKGLTERSHRVVCDAGQVLEVQVHQLEQAEVVSAELEGRAQSLREILSLQEPWGEMAALESIVSPLEEAYRLERQKRLAWQGLQVEQAKGRLKQRLGFGTLGSEAQHMALRYLNQTLSDTSVEALTPALAALKESFSHRLQDAEVKANQRLDELMSEGTGSPVLAYGLTESLRNREIGTVEDAEALADEIREQLMPLLKDGKRIRLV